MLSFSVQDTGIGITPEKQSQVFDPFQQVDSSMTRTRGGTDWAWPSPGSSPK